MTILARPFAEYKHRPSDSADGSSRHTVDKCVNARMLAVFSKVQRRDYRKEIARYKNSGRGNYRSTRSRHEVADEPHG